MKLKKKTLGLNEMRTHIITKSTKTDSRIRLFLANILDENKEQVM